MKRIFTFLLTLAAIHSAYCQDFNEGVFILNEDWYGHNNSTINFIDTSDEVYYRCFQNANNKVYEFGATSQYGIIYGGKLIVMSKQDQDPGDEIQSGRVTVADALTLEMQVQHPMLEQSPNNGKSMADGRGCLGVDEHTAYLGSSNGIYLLDLNSLTIGAKIEGTENPLITGDENNANGTGALYNNQIGTMLRGTDYVFAIYQDRGILVIDPTTHTIKKEIEGCFSTMTQSKDGFIWVGENLNKDYLKYPYGPMGMNWKGTGLKKINQHTLEITHIDLPKEYQISQSWYAWTAGVLHASKQQNVLYWVQSGGWFTGGKTTKIYKYDIATGDVSLFFDFENENPDYAIYAGTGIGVNLIDDMMYVAIQEGEVSNNVFFIYKIDEKGNVVKVYPLISNWWYPAMLISPDKYAPEILSTFPSTITLNDQTPQYTMYIGNLVSDKDNFNGSIVKTIENMSDDSFTAIIKHDTLTVTAKSVTRSAKKTTNHSFDVKCNSNGKIVAQTMNVVMDISSDIQPLFSSNATLFYDRAEACIRLNTKGNIAIYTPNGTMIYQNKNYTINSQIDVSGLPNGVYIVKTDAETVKFTKY